MVQHSTSNISRCNAVSDRSFSRHGNAPHPEWIPHWSSVTIACQSGVSNSNPWRLRIVGTRSIRRPNQLQGVNERVAQHSSLPSGRRRRGHCFVRMEKVEEYAGSGTQGASLSSHASSSLGLGAPFLWLATTSQGDESSEYGHADAGIQGECSQVRRSTMPTVHSRRTLLMCFNRGE